LTPVLQVSVCRPDRSADSVGRTFGERLEIGIVVCARKFKEELACKVRLDVQGLS